MDLKVLAALSIFRVFSVFAVQTFFSPDEYWQSLEVAHKLAFGYGHLTWEWKSGIRSYFYPVVISLFYKALAYFGADSVAALVYGPRILQALISSYADYRFYKWCNSRRWALFIIMSSWFWFYTGSRTLVNSLEASLISIAMSFFPWGKSENTGFIWIVSLLMYIRPTSAVTLLPLCAYHISKSRYSFLEILVKRYLIIGAVTASLMITLDTHCHGSLLITPIEFFKVNVLEGIAANYGTHPFYWYFTSGLPAVLGVNIIPFALAVFKIFQNWNESKDQKTILISIVFTISIYSLIPHKEFRFLLQILPLCLYLIANYLIEWSRQRSTATIWFVALTIFVSNALPAGYLGFAHQQGTLKAMNRVADIVNSYQPGQGHKPSFFFMMPCHSTPYYSHVHANVTMRFLKCEPNLKNEDKYVDEADQFYNSPMKWIRSHLPVHPIDALPTHLVVYDTLAPQITDFLSIYKPLEVFFHSDYLMTTRSGKNVIIFERIDPKPRQEPPKAQKKAEVKQEVKQEL